MNINIKYGIVVKPTVMKGDKIVKEYPLQNNLITDIGLEKLATTFTCDCFVTACVGTNTTPPNWVDTNLGTWVKSSETYMVTTPNQNPNGHSVVIDPGVDTKIKRWRTFVFTEETGPVVYAEAGWSWEAASVSDPLIFGHLKFLNAITLGAGEHLVLYVELRTVIDGTITTIPSLPITGLAVPAKSLFEKTNTRTGETQYDQINSDGTSNHNKVTGGGGGDIEPCNHTSYGTPIPPYDVGSWIGIGAEDRAIGGEDREYADPPIGIYQILGFQKLVLAEPYVALSHQRVYVLEVAPGDIDLTANWYDIRFANSGSWCVSGFRIRFDAVQSKTPANTVKLVFTKSWTRL
jgi:hypothetical protein